MIFTIDFSDGSYLSIDSTGGECIYEDREIDFQGSLKDTLRVIPKSKKVEIAKGLISLNNKQCLIGEENDYNGTSVKAVEWSG